MGNPGHIITSSAEHPVVYELLQEMESQGTEVTFLSPGLWGAIRPEQVEKAKQVITAAIIGLIIIVAAYAITKFVFAYIITKGGAINVGT